MTPVLKKIYISPSIAIKDNILISRNVKPKVKNIILTHNIKVLNTPISRQNNKLNKYLAYGLFNILKKIYNYIGDTQ